MSLLNHKLERKSPGIALQMCSESTSWAFAAKPRLVLLEVGKRLAGVFESRQRRCNYPPNLSRSSH